jgi:hypothetical protein
LLEIEPEFDSCEETAACRKARDLLQQHGLFFIIGPAESGKSALAYALLRYFYQHMNCDPLVLHEYKEFRMHVSLSKRQVVLLDHPFGRDQFSYTDFQT